MLYSGDTVTQSLTTRAHQLIGFTSPNTEIRSSQWEILYLLKRYRIMWTLDRNIFIINIERNVEDRRQRR